MSADPTRPSLRETARVFLKIGFLGFGGPAGQIALMHKMLVEERRWIDEARFLHALNFCMLLPGPEAQQLATYIGWTRHRAAGGVIAGVLFVLPGALIVLALSALYVAFADLAFVAGAFYGVKAAVIAVVVEASARIGRRALKTPALRGVAAAAFVLIFTFAAPFPLIILAAGLVGAFGARVAPEQFPSAPPGAIITEPSAGRPWIAAAVALALWLAPVAALFLMLGPDHVFTQQAVFFSKMAVVTFGGAYAVLAYVAQEAVQTFQWLSPAEMLDGLGLAETTPGPLILVLEFVGFIAAARAETGLPPMVAGALGAALTVWVTFAPCFFWIFAGAPYIERLQRARLISAALAAITAAVVGVVLNLAAWFAAHVVFRQVAAFEWGPISTIAPDFASFDPLAFLLALAATIALVRWKIGMLTVLGAAALAGMAANAAGLTG